VENDSPSQPENPPKGCSTIALSELSNEEFLQRYARPGRIGLSGGRTWIDKVITRAERHLDKEEIWGRWSHAFVFEGSRIDGQQWVIESDLHLERKHIVMGAQENRITKYYNEELYSSLAILDFGLSDAQTCVLLREGLDLVASRNRYSLRELVGTLIALRRPALRAEENLMARERSMYCSAFVQHLFRNIKVDLAPGVHAKNTTPEDIWRSTLPHVSYVLDRAALRTPMQKGRVRLRRRLKARVNSLRSKGKAET
jgi:hypothetical protein